MTKTQSRMAILFDLRMLVVQLLHCLPILVTIAWGRFLPPHDVEGWQRLDAFTDIVYPIIDLPVSLFAQELSVAFERSGEAELWLFMVFGGTQWFLSCLVANYLARMWQRWWSWPLTLLVEYGLLCLLYGVFFLFFVAPWLG